MSRMEFYFSGISGRQEYEMLEAAGVKKLLVDHADARNIPSERRIDMLDSGGYRAFKDGTEINLETYLQNVRSLESRCDYIVAPDVIGKPSQSYQNWQVVKAEIDRVRLIPVWQWDSPREHLETYLGEADTVGIGRLAMIMRAGDKTKEELKRRDRVTAELVDLCRQYPGRFHVFGLNFLQGVERLAPFAKSCDASSWLRGGRYGYIIFQHTKNLHLTQAPAKFIREYAQFDRAGKCIASARNIEKFLSAFDSIDLKQAA